MAYVCLVLLLLYCSLVEVACVAVFGLCFTGVC